MVEIETALGEEIEKEVEKISAQDIIRTQVIFSMNCIIQ
jgi:hypothetical protein